MDDILIFPRLWPTPILSKGFYSAEGKIYFWNQKCFFKKLHWISHDTVKINQMDRQAFAVSNGQSEMRQDVQYSRIGNSIDDYSELHEYQGTLHSPLSKDTRGLGNDQRMLRYTETCFTSAPIPHANFSNNSLSRQMLRTTITAHLITTIRWGHWLPVTYMSNNASAERNYVIYDKTLASSKPKIMRHYLEGSNPVEIWSDTRTWNIFVWRSPLTLTARWAFPLLFGSLFQSAEHSISKSSERVNIRRGWNLLIQYHGPTSINFESSTGRYHQLQKRLTDVSRISTNDFLAIAFKATKMLA